jgi:hypothetical protein
MATYDYSYSVHGDTYPVHLEVTERLRLETKSESMDIPLSSVQGYCVDASSAGQLPFAGVLVVSYLDGEKKKVLEVPVGLDLLLKPVIDELKARRPDANLLGLPPDEAMERLGRLPAHKLMFRTSLAVLLALGVLAWLTW